MASSSLYRQLVPDAPLHRRTDRDVYASPQAELRVKLAGRLIQRPVRPGLQEPTLVSSWRGAIETVLFAFPSYGVSTPDYAAAYRSVVGALRQGTRFVVVHHRATRAEVEKWFREAGHPEENVTYVDLPDYVSFTDWAEDAYVSLLDAADDTAYLMEPWEFPRAGDALIAESVQEHAALTAAQAPLIFQGGNCLIGERFWLLGKDYFADSVALVEGDFPPVEIPGGTGSDAFVARLFAEYVDAGRELVVVGTARPIPVREFYGSREGDEYHLDIAGDGAGTYQPIFHIDMFITVVGPDDDGGGFDVLVGSPSLGDAILGTRSPFALDDVYDAIAGQLAGRGMRVERNPLVHRPTPGRTFTVAQLRDIATQQGADALLEAVDELVAAGADDTTSVRVRTWHHVTWNNCLVENGAVGRHVYLPTFGHGRNRDLEPVDQAMKELWERRGFTVHLLGDFNGFASRQGVVHCIKKYLRRGH